MRKARSLAGLFEWSAVHSDVGRVVSLDRPEREPVIWAKKKSLERELRPDSVCGGDGGIRTHVPISRQNDFESLTGEIPPVRSGSQECRPGSRKTLC